MRGRQQHPFVLCLGAIAAALLVLVETIEMPLRVVYNISPSAPLGVYLARDPAPVQRGDLVVARLPPPWQAWAAARGYVGRTLPLIKRVAALAGDHVCARDGGVFVNGHRQAGVLERDGRGRPLPRWRGCRRLERGEVLVLMVEAPASFDGRYFGPLGSEHIVGRLRPLWLR